MILEEGNEMYCWQLNQSSTLPNSGVENGYLYDVIDKEFALHAVAIAKEVTIMFNPNNGSSEVPRQEVSFGSTITLRKNTFKRSGESSVKQQRAI